jgi:hypothetical protein
MNVAISTHGEFAIAYDRLITLTGVGKNTHRKKKKKKKIVESIWDRIRNSEIGN